MKLKVATLNPQKINAVKEIIKDYPMLAGAEVIGVSFSSGISEQPKSLDETVVGALNRAKNAFTDCDYSFGIESGLMAVPHSKTGFLDVCVCLIYDGKESHIGFSSAFEPPKKIAQLMHEGMDMSRATAAAGLTTDEYVGHKGGLISILTHGRLNRLQQTKQALTTALIHLENAHLFKE